MFKTKEVNQAGFGFAALLIGLMLAGLLSFVIGGNVADRLIFVIIGMLLFAPFTTILSYLIGEIAWNLFFTTDTLPTPDEQSLIDKTRNLFKDFERKNLTKHELRRLTEMLRELAKQLERRIEKR